MDSDVESSSQPEDEAEGGQWFVAKSGYELSTDLMMVILATIITKDNRHLRVFRRNYPFEHSKKRCDIVIKYIEQYSGQWQNLCFMVVLSLPVLAGTGLSLIEQEALRWCQEFVVNQDVQISYAATIASNRVRLWQHIRDSGTLDPMWGPPEPGQWDYYIDVGDKDNVNLIAKTILEMLQHPPTAVHPSAVVGFTEVLYDKSTSQQSQ